MTELDAIAELSSDTSLPMLDGTVGQQLRLQASRNADLLAVMWVPSQGDTAALTYAELLVAVEAEAGRLAQIAVRGDRVAVWAANCVQWLIVEYAAALTGTILAPLNTAWTDDELQGALTQVRPAAFYAGRDGRGTDLLRRAGHLVDSDDGYTVIDLNDVAVRPRPTPYSGPELSADDPMLIQFTSGTTGQSKGATLTHRSILNAGHFRAAATGAAAGDVWVNPIPLHHVGGSAIIAMASLCTGGCYVALPRFHAVTQVSLMAAVGATHTGGVPTMLDALLEVPGFDTVLAGLRSVGIGGTSVPPSLVERISAHGARVSLAYAQSECPMITQTGVSADPVQVATTVGTPVPHTEIRICDDTTGNIVRRNQIGEVCVRSPLTMLGYWDLPQATSEVFDGQGFLRTGDLGSIDSDGVVRIHGRAREVIIRGGENIYPAEIENVMLRHPAVAAIAVVGTPSVRWGEEVAAVVQTATEVTVDELETHARASLAHFKIPRHWRFVEDLPLTASGKVRKFELPALFVAESPA